MEREFREGDTIERMLPCRKRPMIVHARQMHEPFTVVTREGTIRGKAGDYLMKGVRGELYPCDRKIFEDTYDFLDGSEETPA